MDWSVVGTIALLLASTAAVPLLVGSRRLRVLLAAQLERLARRVRPPQEPAPDPFAVLRVQTRLGALADEVRTLQDDVQVYAKAHRLRATRAAYDDLLEEACRLAGVPVDPATPRGEGERMREEVELAARGWSW